LNSTFQNFYKSLIQHGLEGFGLFYGSYRGTVIDNKDPEMLGRLKINCFFWIVNVVHFFLRFSVAPERRKVEEGMSQAGKHIRKTKKAAVKCLCDTHNSLCSAAGQLSGDFFNIGLSVITLTVYIPEESEKCQAICEKNVCYHKLPSFFWLY